MPFRAEGEARTGAGCARKGAIRAHYVSNLYSMETGDRATERGCGPAGDATGGDGGAGGTEASAGDCVCRQTWRQAQSPAGAGVESAPPSPNVGGVKPPYPLGVAFCPLAFVPFRAEGVGTSGSACAREGAKREHYVTYMKPRLIAQIPLISNKILEFQKHYDKYLSIYP